MVVEAAEAAPVLTEAAEESIPAVAVVMPEAGTAVDTPVEDIVAVPIMDMEAIMVADIMVDTDTGGAATEDGDLDWDSALG